VTLLELQAFAESLGALIVPDEHDGPEIIFDSQAFESFADGVFQAGLTEGLKIAQTIVDNLKMGGADA
jgi:hypothetical protein